MLENVTRPLPPNQSEGCWACGGGKDRILKSLLIGGMSVAVCPKHEALDPRVPVAKLSLQVTN